MQPLEQNAYSHAEVKEMLHSDARTVRFRYRLLDRANKFVRELTNIESCTISHNADNDIKRTANFKVRDDGNINWLAERIQPFIEFQMPEGDWLSWPLGVFLLDASDGEVTETGVTFRNVKGFDQGKILKDDNVSVERITYTAGQYPQAYVAALLRASGINDIAYVSNTITTASYAMSWDGGTSIGTVINDILREREAFEPIWFDGMGVARCEPKKYHTLANNLPGKPVSDYEYVTDDESVIHPGLKLHNEYADVPNTVTVIMTRSDRSVLSKTVQNDNDSSPTSLTNRGRPITKVVKLKDSEVQGTVTARAWQELYDASQVYDEVEFETALMPHHEHRDLILLDHIHLDESALFEEVGWSMKLEVDGVMTHKLRLVNSVFDSDSIDDSDAISNYSGYFPLSAPPTEISI